jgi:hypothetical protein
MLAHKISVLWAPTYSIFYDVEFGLWFSVRVLVFHLLRCELTVVEVQRCGLSKVWFGGDGWVHQGMWLVLLESAKDQFLGVDTPKINGATTCPVWNDFLTN